MKEGILNTDEEENKNELSLEKVRELLNIKDGAISDERLLKVINSVKIFCKVAYELYLEEQNQKSIEQEKNIIELHSDELKKAA